MAGQNAGGGPGPAGRPAGPGLKARWAARPRPAASARFPAGNPYLCRVRGPATGRENTTQPVVLQLVRRFQYIKLVAADFGAALVAWGCFYVVRKYLLNEMTGYRFTEGALFDLTGSAVFIASFWTLLYALVGEYRDIYRKSRLAEIIRLARVSALGAVVIFFTLLLDDQGVVNYRAYYKTFSAYYLLHFFISAVLRLWAVSSVQRQIRRGRISFPTLLVGSNALAFNTLHELARSSRHLGLRLVGFTPVGDSVDPGLAAALPARGTYQRLPALVRALGIEQIVIAIEPSEHRLIADILTLLEGTPARVSILPDLYQMLLGSVKVNHLFGTPLIEIKQDLLPVWQVVLKRVIDVVGSALFMLLAWWVYAFTAVMVKLSSPGPVFYRQVRIGRNGLPFNIIKFRSMFTDAENGCCSACSQIAANRCAPIVRPEPFNVCAASIQAFASAASAILPICRRLSTRNKPRISASKSLSPKVWRAK